MVREFIQSECVQMMFKGALDLSVGEFFFYVVWFRFDNDIAICL